MSPSPYKENLVSGLIATLCEKKLGHRTCFSEEKQKNGGGVENSVGRLYAYVVAVTDRVGNYQVDMHICT